MPMELKNLASPLKRQPKKKINKVTKRPQQLKKTKMPNPQQNQEKSLMTKFKLKLGKDQLIKL